MASDPLQNSSEKENWARIIAFVIPICAVWIWVFRDCFPFHFFQTIINAHYELREARFPGARQASIGLVVPLYIFPFALGLWIICRLQEKFSPQEPAEKSTVKKGESIFILMGIFFIGLIGTYVYPELFSLLIIAAGWAFGNLLLSHTFLKKANLSSAGKAFISTTLGMGFLSLLIFILGQAGLLFSNFWRILILGIIALNVIFTLRTPKTLPESKKGFLSFAGTPTDAFVSILFLTGFFWIFSHFFTWHCPPVEYDVLEYHLGGPGTYLRDGTISFQEQNIYTSFPSIAEMLYLLGLVVGKTEADLLGGVPLSHILLFSFWVISIYLVYLIAETLCNLKDEKDKTKNTASLTGTTAAFLYALIPMGSYLSADFYVEHIQAAFHLAAIYCLLLLFKNIGNHKDEGVSKPNSSLIVLSGIFAGLAAGTKYTALLFTAASILVILFLLVIRHWSIRHCLKTVLLFVVPFFLVLSPWLIRNFVNTGDPFFPVGSVFIQRFTPTINTVPTLLDYFDVAHRSGPWSFAALTSIFEQFATHLNSNAMDEWARELKNGFYLIGFLPAAFLIRPKNIPTGLWICVALFILNVAIWFLFTHRLFRFLFPSMGLLAVLAGVGFGKFFHSVSTISESKILRRTGFGFAAFSLVAVLYVYGPWQLSVTWNGLAPQWITHKQTTFSAGHEKLKARGNPFTAEAFEIINRGHKSGHIKKVLLVGEARIFYINAPIEYGVVFNRQPFAELFAPNHSGKIDESLWKTRLKEKGITHIFINFRELDRLARSYAIKKNSITNKWEAAALPGKSFSPKANLPGLASWAKEIERDAAKISNDKIHPAMKDILQLPLLEIDLWLLQNARLIWKQGVNGTATYQIWEIIPTDSEEIITLNG